MLIYRSTKYRRATETFDGNDNIGARVVIREVEKSGIRVGYCSPESAHQHRVVLVSLTSTYDVIALYRAVALRPDWQPGKRAFSVVAGGFGMQNPSSIRHYADYAYYGRAEGHIAKIAQQLIEGLIPDHPSLMHLPELHPVDICQATSLYDGSFDLGKKGHLWHETFIGCPNKCKFCHYTWARKHIGDAGQYRQDGLTGRGKGNSPEVLWRDIERLEAKPGRLRTALDGFSERLRCTFGKKIKREQISRAINRMGKFKGNTVILAYNIANMPTETEDDRLEMYESIRGANPFNRVVFILHSTPFRPSPLTPMSHCAASLEPYWHRKTGNPAIICDRGNLLAMHSRQMESPRSHLETLIAERATPATDKLFHAICFAPKLQAVDSIEWLRLVRSNFDLSQYLRCYDPEEKIPTWFLSGWCKDMDKAIRWVDRRINCR
jgi:hypothetical protein